MKKVYKHYTQPETKICFSCKNKKQRNEYSVANNKKTDTYGYKSNTKIIKRLEQEI
jgi:hypothetical protein